MTVFGPMSVWQFDAVEMYGEIPYISPNGDTAMNKPLRPPQGERPATAGATKTTRFETRLSRYARKIIKHAAEIQGRSMSDFVVAAAEQAAEKAIRDAHIIELSIDDQRKFAEALLNPPKLGPVWKRARETHRRLIRESQR